MIVSWIRQVAPKAFSIKAAAKSVCALFFDVALNRSVFFLSLLSSGCMLLELISHFCLVYCWPHLPGRKFHVWINIVWDINSSLKTPTTTTKFQRRNTHTHTSRIKTKNQRSKHHEIFSLDIRSIARISLRARTIVKIAILPC